MLQAIAEDASRCCKRAWQKLADKEALQSEFECPKCGCTYRPMEYAGMRVWEYSDVVSLIQKAESMKW